MAREAAELTLARRRDAEAGFRAMLEREAAALAAARDDPQTPGPGLGGAAPATRRRCGGGGRRGAGDLAGALADLIRAALAAEPLAGASDDGALLVKKHEDLDRLRKTCRAAVHAVRDLSRSANATDEDSRPTGPRPSRRSACSSAAARRRSGPSGSRGPAVLGDHAGAEAAAAAALQHLETSDKATMRLPFDAGAPKTLALTIGAAAALERGRLDKSIKFVQAGLRHDPDSAPLKKQYDGLKSLKRKTEAVDKHLRKGYSVKRHEVAFDACDGAVAALDSVGGGASADDDRGAVRDWRACIELVGGERMANEAYAYVDDEGVEHSVEHDLRRKLQDARRGEDAWEKRRDHAKVLELPANVDSLSKDRKCFWLKKHHKKMARQWHPDKARGSKERAARKMAEMVITTREAIVASFDAPSKLSAAGSTELSMRCVNGESPETGSSTGLDSSGYSIGTPLRRQIPRSATPTGRASPSRGASSPAAVAGPRAAAPLRRRRTVAASRRRRRAAIVEDLDSDSDFFVRGDGERLLKGGALELGGAAVFGLLVATARAAASGEAAAIAAVEWTLDAAAEATLAGAVVKLGFLEQNGERGFYGLAPTTFDDDGVYVGPAIRRYDRGDPNSPRAVVDAHLLDGCVAVAADGDAFRVDFPPAVAETLVFRVLAAARGDLGGARVGDAPTASAPSAEEPEHRGPSPYDLACELRRSAPDVAMEGLLWRRGAATPWKKRHASLVLDGRRTRLVYRNGDARVLGECFLRDLADVVSVDGGGHTGACFDLTFAGGGDVALRGGRGRGVDAAIVAAAAARAAPPAAARSPPRVAVDVREALKSFVKRAAAAAR
ncbi:hypothetical protein JL720_4077 [Aureococcus anophagefferens]|nr:hypothetical protein JL720_4077 [Aureococcus anophagefferens]